MFDIHFNIKKLRQEVDPLLESKAQTTVGAYAGKTRQIVYKHQ